MIKVVSGIAVHPDIIVMTLNGKGVIPAVKTAKKPKLLKRLLNSYIASVLPSAVKMGCPRLSKAIAPIKYPRIPPNTDDIHANRCYQPGALWSSQNHWDHQYIGWNRENGTFDKCYKS